MATKPAQQKIREGVLQTKEKDKTSMSLRGWGHAKIPTKRGKKIPNFIKNQPNDRNQYTIFNKPLDISGFISPNQKTN